MVPLLLTCAKARGVCVCVRPPAAVSRTAARCRVAPPVLHLSRDTPARTSATGTEADGVKLEARCASSTAGFWFGAVAEPVRLVGSAPGLTGAAR